jgi:CSLREA domain-containing protein
MQAVTVRAVGRRLTLLAAAVLVVGLPSLVLARSADAAPAVLSLTVNTTADLPQADPQSAVCADSAGQCSLRAAIQVSDAQPAGTVTDVSVPAGTYALSLGPLAVTANTVAVTGAGSTATVVENAKRVKGQLFTVAATSIATLADLELTGGSRASKTTGGALANSGTTTLDTVVVTKNSSPAGGGLTNAKGASLTLVDSTVTANSALSARVDSKPGGSAGGILNAGLLQLSGSTVSGNTAGSGGFGGSDTAGRGGDGGGIVNTGTASIDASTISGNTAGSGGVGLSNSELSGIGGDGGGIYSSGGSLTLTNSTVSSNAAGYPGPLGEAPFPRAGDGGGIWSSTALHVSSTSFSSNTTADPPSSQFAAPGAGGSGGAVYTTGTATIASSTFTSNAAGAGETQGPGTGAGGDGGGIASLGTLTLTGSTLTGNTAGNGGGSANGGAGGGLYSGHGMAKLTGDTFSADVSGTGGNAIPVDPGCAPAGTGGDGGAIYSSASLVVSDSTLSGNSVGQGGFLSPPCAGQVAGGVGAGVATGGGSATISYTTVADNADGIANTAGTVTLTGTIVADSTGANCTGTISEGAGYNLDSGTTCHFGAPTDVISTEPQLGQLANNGGPTETRALTAGSPAVDHGGTATAGCPATDQRGHPRPDEAADNGACDMGAYESHGIG